ncbi:MAG: polyribonucleotide nucleotidyltransferase [Candidatus Omnitrophica bacterium]|nr:polyribonucleotide nucleotidyltransferase [Candidatus Omnitrophota bacterium]MBU4477987.1 polyribonucleotide nucleotidyltransferase [Candidatus Omnitrophota bacterium]MCG2704189.1 polyribonucleotide nucleotidyltransferase [Candidatus Omnitrophota bacterium]
MLQKIEIKFGKETLIFETGKLAKQANSAVTVQCGGTVVLVATVMAKEAKKDIDFLPLTVEYKEKTYAAGRIPGGFFKREGRPSEKEILTARLIDRPIRPLFPQGFYNEVQIMAIVLSSDGKNDPDVLSMLGASCALMISDIPFLGPMGAVKIGRINNEFIINPTYEELEQSSIELVLAGTRNGINMIESGCKQVSEELIVEAMKFGYEYILPLIELQESFAAKAGKEKANIILKKLPEELCAKVKELSIAKLTEVYKIGSKEQREEELQLIAKNIVETLITPDSPYSESDVKAALVKVEKEQVRKIILETKTRVDGRNYTQIRLISAEVGLLPRTHGSALFTRGQTQSLSVATLGTSSDEQIIDALEGESFKNFMLHYNFPSFSVGEVRPIRGPGRREIGHGALAERALLAVMPSKEKFPYTVRLVSEVLESNGSSSMATVCAGTLALMDAGVPITAPVTGIAMGLLKEEKETVILTDILGLEDHFGDMDFKVTGTKEGITAIQLDLKIDGIELDVLEKALKQAKDARLFILGEIMKVIDKPRPELSLYAPRITVLKIPTDKIRDLIGPGGKMIKKITSETGVKIDIEDDGTVFVASTDAQASKKAIDIINSLTAEVEAGKIYTGKITRIMNFGAFCEILPQKEGLIHISELAQGFVKNVEDVVKIGDVVTVKVIEIDSMNRINLSIKQAAAPLSASE